MRNPDPEDREAFVDVPEGGPEIVYASDVRILAEPGGLHLTFVRPRAKPDTVGSAVPTRGQESEVIARVVLPPVAARRLLRLLPRRLDLQQALAEDYDRETEEEAARDPFTSALDAAEDDDEPFTDDDRAAAEAGWQEYLDGETLPWDEAKRELFHEDEASSRAAS